MKGEGMVNTTHSACTPGFHTSQPDLTLCYKVSVTGSFCRIILCLYSRNVWNEPVHLQGIHGMNLRVFSACKELGKSLRLFLLFVIAEYLE
jgi:hypothetical protein